MIALSVVVCILKGKNKAVRSVKRYSGRDFFFVSRVPKIFATFSWIRAIPVSGCARGVGSELERKRKRAEIGFSAFFRPLFPFFSPALPLSSLSISRLCRGWIPCLSLSQPAGSLLSVCSARVRLAPSLSGARRLCLHQAWQPARYSSFPFLFSVSRFPASAPLSLSLSADARAALSIRGDLWQFRAIN